MIIIMREKHYSFILSFDFFEKIVILSLEKQWNAIFCHILMNGNIWYKYQYAIHRWKQN